MFRNNLILRLRSLWRNRTHAAINIVGLSLGITSAIVIFLIITFVNSYDTYRADSDRIYRVVVAFDYGDGSAHHGVKTEYTASNTYPFPAAMRNDFPDVEFVSLLD